MIIQHSIIDECLIDSD